MSRKTSQSRPLERPCVVETDALYQSRNALETASSCSEVRCLTFSGTRRGRGRDLGRVAGFTFVADTGFDEPQGGVIKPLNKAGYFFLHGISSVPISDFSGYAGYPTG